MPVVLLAQAELARGGDHAVGDVPVGLARGDRERAGQHGAGQGDDDLVADEEVAAPQTMPRTSAPPSAAVCTLGRDANGAPADGLAVRLRLGRELEHLADDDGAGDVEAVDGLLLEPDPDERRVQVGDGRARRAGRRTRRAS